MKRIGKWLLGLITSALTLVLMRAIHFARAGDCAAAVRREVDCAHHAG